MKKESQEHADSLSRRSALQMLGGATIATAVPLTGVMAQEAAKAFNGATTSGRDTLFAYRSFWPEFGAMAQFREAGVNTVCIFAANTDNSLGTPYSTYPPIWRWFGKYDFDSLDKQFDDVLAVNADAEFICMIDLNTPVWLAHQLATRRQSAESDSFTMLSCACANPAWRKATSEYLETIVKHMEARYGDRVKAYLLACGQTDEWMDYSQGNAGRTKTRAWEMWLEQHGKEKIPVPALERMDRASMNNLVRDPAVEQDIVDYAQFTGELIVDTALAFAKTTRSLIPRKRQIGMFFGYALELTTSRLVWAGHLEYERLFASPDIDFLISPGTYSDRSMGGGSGFMLPNGTRVLNGKGHLHEIDHRTPTYNYKLDDFVSIGSIAPWKNQAEVNAGLKREFSLAIINNASLWCFDMWGGVFKTPETMSLVAQSKQLWNQYASENWKSRAEVALIVDPQSARYLNDRNSLIPHIYQGTRNKLNRLGAPFEVFSFNDLSRAKLDQYKLLIFPGLFQVTPEKRSILRDYVFKDNRTVLFVYAPGICTEKDLDLARVKGLTGTDFNTPGVSRVRRDGWVSVYVPDYETVTPQVLKQIAKEAGVTLYCQDEVPVYANERLVAIHVAKGGDRNITIPSHARQVKELYTGRVIPVVNQQFGYRFSTPDTALFEVE